MLAGLVVVPITANAMQPITVHVRHAGEARILGPGDAFQMEVYLDNPSNFEIGAISFFNIEFNNDYLEWDLRAGLPFAPGEISSAERLALIPSETIADNGAFFSFASGINFPGSGTLMTLNLRVKSGVTTVDTFVNASFVTPTEPESTRGGAGITCFFASETLPYTFAAQPVRIVTHALSVTGSNAADSGAGEYAAGVDVTVRAGESYHLVFTHWTAVPPVNFADPTSPVTTFEMPASPVVVTAHWTDDTRPEYLVTVTSQGASGSSGGGNYREERTVRINAGTRAGHVFNGWSVTEGNVVLHDANSEETSFVMPASNVTVVANWIPYFAVTVNNSHAGEHRGAGNYTVGSEVTISAGSRPLYSFVNWSVSGAGAGGVALTNPNAPITTFTMASHGDVTLTANWATTALPGDPIRTAPWPLSQTAILGHRNAPSATRSIWALPTASFGGVPNTNSTLASPALTEANTPHLFAMTSAENGNGVRAVVEVNITGNELSIRGRGHNGTTWVSGNWGTVFNTITGADQSRLLINAAGTQYGVSWGATIPDGWVEFGRHTPAFALTVENSHAGATGAANFLAGDIATVNAGVREGYVFTHWTASPPMNFDNANAQIASFTMPASAVTVTAHWQEADKDNPIVNFPTNLTAVFGQTLGNVILPGNPGGTPGVFSWTAPVGTPVGNVGTPLHNLTFTPSQTAYFYTVNQDVAVTVTPAIPSALSLPSASAISTGQPLSASVLTGGTAGTWAWANGTIVPSVGTNQPFGVIFTPNDIVNFNWTGVAGWNPATSTVARTVNVTVLPPLTVTLNGIGTDGGSTPSNPVTFGTIVSIDAGTRDGHIFDRWTITSGQVLVGGYNQRNAQTSFSMPNSSVVLEASWTPVYAVTVISEDATGIAGNGNFVAGQPVSISAGTRPGFRFTEWTVTEGGPLSGGGPMGPFNLNHAATTFNMPANAVTIVASWEELPMLPQNAAVGFVYLFTNPANGWTGFNNSGPQVEFDITLHQDVVFTLPPWEGGNGTLHATYRDIYLLQPTAAASPNRLPVVLHSITVDGEHRFGPMNTHAPAADRWLVASTLGTLNPVNTVGGGANAQPAFAAAGMQLRTFLLPANAFLIPDEAVVEITYRVGDGPSDGPHSVTVNSANATSVMGGGDFEAGDIVNIFAGARPGFTFNGWTSPQSVAFNNASNSFTSFVMPSRDVTVTANWTATIVDPGNVSRGSSIGEADVTLLTRYLLATDKLAFMAANPEFIYDNAYVSGGNTISTFDLTVLKSRLP